MSLYCIVPDLENYAYIGFDRDEIEEKFGDDMSTHIDMSCKPRPDLASWQPINVSLSGAPGEITGSKTADIMQFKGKLFLSLHAYEVLLPVIQNDGEFLPVTYENGEGYIFNPLSLAESVDGLDESKSKKTGKRDITRIHFHEERVSQFSIFKTEFDNYISVICNESVKTIIEAANLKGVEFREELAANFL